MGLGLIGGNVGVCFGSVALMKTQKYQITIIIVTTIALTGFCLATALKNKRFLHWKNEGPYYNLKGPSF